MPTRSYPSPVAYRWPILALSASLYLTAFAAPYNSGIGLTVFAWGLVYCWMLPWTFSWWANVAYWVACGCFCAGNWSRAAVWGLVATALAGGWLLVEPLARQALAYQLWVGSMVVLGAVALVLASWPQQDPPSAGELHESTRVYEGGRELT